ncbi:MAG: sugar ABC transporter permease [Rhizobiales bacterium]|nr:sugar ABC transporter permease [Hyphomicrobiales bacterium]NRB15580.1 sugar ABC transporter permease [Hyphomicrobiales bacterium]
MFDNIDKSKYLALLVLLLPSLLGMLAFVIAPIIASLILSFSQWDLIGDVKWIGFDNYTTIIFDPAVRTALFNTLMFIAGYLPSVIVIALGLALVLNSKIKAKTFFRAVYFVPVVTSWVAVSLVWKWMLNPVYGIVNYGLSFVGIDGPGWLYDPNWAMAGVILTTVWKDIGFVMVIYLAGLQDIPENLYEAAELEDANAWQKFRFITWPLLARTTFFVTTISLINSFQVFDQIWVMTKGGPAGSTSVMMELIYKNAFSYYKMGYASAISWVLFVIIFAVTITQNYLQKQRSAYNV